MADDKKVIFSMTGVSKTYASANQPVLKNIYLSFFYGAKIGILGLNGSCKTLVTSLPNYPNNLITEPLISELSKRPITSKLPSLRVLPKSWVAIKAHDSTLAKSIMFNAPVFSS